jgi:hypothetical protein
MPFNPAQFVFQPRPLQQFDFGASFNDLAQGRMQRTQIANQDRQAAAQLAEQQAARADLNTRFSAELAATQNEAQYKAVMDRYKRLNDAINSGRVAANTGQWNQADVAVPQVRELGGTAYKTFDDGMPSWHFQGPSQEPTRPPLDVQGMRNEVFGTPGQPQPSSPTNAPTNAPGAGRNPFDTLTGRSEAALPQPPPPPPPAARPEAGPPPGPAAAAPQQPPTPQTQPTVEEDLARLQKGVDAYDAGQDPAAAMANPPTSSSPAPATTVDQDVAKLQSDMDAHDAARQSGGQQQQPQLIGPNPFDPFAISSRQVGEQNRLRLQPWLNSIQRGYPDRFQPRLTELNQEALALNMPPDKTLDQYYKALTPITSLMKSEYGAEAAQARLSASGANSEANRNIRLEDRTWRRANDIIRDEDLIETKRKMKVADGVYDNLKLAVNGNPNAASELIAQLYRMNQAGVMTDKDYENEKEGVRTLYSSIKGKTVETFFTNGLDPDKEDDLKRLLDVAMERHGKHVAAAQDQLWTLYQRAGSEEERKAALDAIAGYIPRKYRSDEVKRALGDPIEQKSGPVDQSGNYSTKPGATSTKTRVSASVKTSSKKPDDDDEMSDAEFVRQQEEEMAKDRAKRKEQGR